MATAKQNVGGQGAIKPPEEWVTGDEPMTGAQESYLNTLAREAGEQVEEDLTKAEASEKIEELQEQTGRGVNTGAAGQKGPQRKRRGAAARSETARDPKQ